MKYQKTLRLAKKVMDLVPENTSRGNNSDLFNDAILTEYNDGKVQIKFYEYQLLDNNCMTVFIRPNSMDRVRLDYLEENGKWEFHGQPQKKSTDVNKDLEYLIGQIESGNYESSVKKDTTQITFNYDNTTKRDVIETADENMNSAQSENYIDFMARNLDKCEFYTDTESETYTEKLVYRDGPGEIIIINFEDHDNGRDRGLSTLIQSSLTIDGKTFHSNLFSFKVKEFDSVEEKQELADKILSGIKEVSKQSVLNRARENFDESELEEDILNLVEKNLDSCKLSHGNMLIGNSYMEKLVLEIGEILIRVRNYGDGDSSTIDVSDSYGYDSLRSYETDEWARDNVKQRLKQLDRGLQAV